MQAVALTVQLMNKFSIVNCVCFAALSHPLSTVSPESHIRAYSLRRTGDKVCWSVQKVTGYVSGCFYGGKKVAKGF